jgi:hypothetical protein
MPSWEDLQLPPEPGKTQSGLRSTHEVSLASSYRVLVHEAVFILGHTGGRDKQTGELVLVVIRALE